MWKVAIPSYNRSSVLRNKTLPFLAKHRVPPEDITIFVASEDERRLYEECLLPGSYGSIVVGTLGIVHQRNYITAYYPKDAWVLCMDDDVEDVLTLENGRLEPVRDFKVVVDLGFQTCVDTGRHLWGLYPVANAFFMRPTTTTDMRFCIGNCYGMINQRIYLRAELKEDYELTMSYSKLDGGVVRLNWLTAKTRMGASGGVGKTRAQRVNTNISVVSMFHKVFPDFFRENKKRPGEILLKKEVPV